MPLKRIAKISIITVVAFVCVLTSAYYYFFHVYMPKHFQENVLPNLMRDAGISGFSGKVKSVGASGANLGELCIGDPENPALKVRSVIIKYRFHNIFMPSTPDVTSLEFNGLELICRMKDKRFEVNNIDVEKFIEQLKKHFSGKHKKAVGSWGNTKLKITDGLIHLDLDGTRLLLPFELTFNPEKQNWEIFRADLQFTWREHPIKAELLVDLKNKTTEINFNARTEMKKMFSLVERSQQFNALPELRLAGLIDVKGNINFAFSPFKIKEMMVSGTSKNCEINYGALSIHNKQRRSALKIPLTISVSSDGKNFIWKLKNGLIKRPTSLFVREMSCFVPIEKRKTLRFEGDVELDLSRLELIKYYGIKNVSDINLIRKISGRYNQVTKNWQIKTADSGRHARNAPIKSNINYDDTKIFADISELGFSGRGCGQNGNLAVKILLKEVSATEKQNAFFCNNAELNSNFTLIPASNGKVRIKNNRFKFTIPELFSSSLERRAKAKGLTVSGSNSFDGFKMNGFHLIADSENINIKENSKLLNMENNKLTLDGIFMKNKGIWELAITSQSKNIEGKYKDNDFDLQNAQSKNFLSLTGSLFNWSGAQSCNVRLKCDAGRYGNEKSYSKFSGFNIGTALVFDNKMRLQKKTFSGGIEKIDLKYKGNDIAASKLEIVGTFNRDKGKKKEDMNLLTKLAAKSISVQRDDIKYLTKSASLNLAGETFNGVLNPKSLRLGLVLPELSILRDKEQIKLVETSLKTVASFYNDNSDKNWHRSLENINLELGFDKVSGVWKGINILSVQNQINAKAEIGVKKSVLYIKKLTAEANAEKTVAYSKSWKLGSQKISVNSTSYGTTDSKLTLKPNLKLYDFYISSRDASLSVPEALIAADFTGTKVSGKLSYDKATFQKNNLDLICRQISVNLPFGDAAAEGEMAINRIELRKQNLGKLSAKLKIEDDDLIIKASHFSEIFSNANMFFSGKMKLSDFPAWKGDFKVPEFKAKNISGASVFFPRNGVEFLGKVALEGHLEGGLSKCKGSGIISIKDGDLNFDSWKLSGLTTTCTFTDLFNVKSIPRQKLRCRQLRNDSLKFTNMHLEFQSHGMKKLQIERLSADWFGGNLTSLTPFAIENYNSIPEKVNFLSSKITLSPLLDYLGIKGFATDAFVGGIIPFSVKNNKVFILGASLATKTSNRGFLCMNDDWSKYIASGTDKAQISEKKFTAAVLKRFNYNWIRLNISTSSEMSSVDLSIDGYPDKAVPFIYNAKKSLYEEIADEELGINNEMTIETKFRIPKN
jgi:Dicarboxylate transport